MNPGDWINLGNALATFVGVMVALGIAVRSEINARKAEEARRVERRSEVFQRPLALAEIALTEMRRLFKQITRAYGENEWGAPPEPIPTTVRLLNEFEAIALIDMPTANSMRAVWTIRSLLIEAKAQLVEFVNQRNTAGMMRGQDAGKLEKTFEDIEVQRGIIKRELMVGATP